MKAPEDSPSSSLTPTSSGSALLDPAEARVARALHKYGIAREDWEDTPEISPIIWRTMDSQKQAMETLRFSDDLQVRKLLKIYFAMSKVDQEKLPLEIPCLAAKVSPYHILGQIVVQFKEISKMESALILIRENPNILRASAAFGKTMPQNVADRQNILKATGTLPSPAGQSINLNFGKQEETVNMEDLSADNSNLEVDVFAYDTQTIDGWGDQRRQLMDEDKRK